MTDLKDYKNEFSTICSNTVKRAESAYSLFTSPTSDFSKLVVHYYSFACLLLTSIQEADSLMLKLSLGIQNEDAADRHEAAAALHSLFEHCAMLRKSIEDFLSSTELAKDDPKSFLYVFNTETEKLVRKTLILKDSAISMDLL